MSAPTVTRRDFLKATGSVVTLAGLGGLFATAGTAVAASGEAVDDEARGMLIDLTRCTGCNSCAHACKAANNLPDTGATPSQLDSQTYSFVDVRQNPETGKDLFVKRQCMHCVDPACASACTVGALRKTADGPVTYDTGKCFGCRYCQYACPFGVPKYDWQNPLGLIHKCEMCKERLQEGEQPACVAACPAGALQFGRRKDLLIQAHARITSKPDRYIDHVYGEHEAGGTSMLYLSGVPFDQVGLPELSDQTISHYAVGVMTKTPFVALSVATVATGLHFALRSRDHAGHDESETHPHPSDEAES